MKTTYILHGGFTQGEIQEDNLFFSEILRTAPKSTNVLLVYFAKESDRVEKNKQEDIEQFSKNRGDKTLFFDVATEETLEEQIKKADIVYLHGGHTGKLLEALKKFPDFRKWIQGKIVAGDSAGTNVLCAVFYSLKIGVGEGFGIIPIKILCHYTEENKNVLNDIKPELETLHLRENEFRVYEIDSVEK